MTQTNKKFNELYGRLNKAQKEAVDTIEGPVMVLAGPGTGKTQVLTLRIANILRQTDTNPENILALTFTEAASKAMRRRLVDIIGSPAYQINISTFHGFCNDIIRNWPEEFPKIIGSANISEVEQITILKKLIGKLKLSTLRPFGDPFYYLQAIRSAIDTLKREDIGETEFSRLVLKQAAKLVRSKKNKKLNQRRLTSLHRQEKDVQKNKELALVYKNYQQELAKRQFYDYSDMIVEVIRALKKNKDLLLELQESYLYLLADEHQDANHAQNKILELLASYYQTPNLFIVGDQKQAIFRFQGASANNFLFFNRRYPNLKIINLTHNYRSTQKILDAAHDLDQKNLAGGESKKLFSTLKEAGKEINLYEFSKPAVEQYFLASDIKQKIAAGAKPGEIAIFYRDNQDVAPIAAELEKQNIPFLIESDQNILEDKDIKKLIRLLETVNSFGQDEKLVSALHIDFLGLDPLEVYKIVAYAKENKKSLFSVLESEPNEPLSSFYKKLSTWRVLSKNEGLLPVFETVVRESGLLDHFLKSSDSFEKLDKLNTLFDEAKALVERNKNATLAAFIEHLDMLASYKVFLKKNIASAQINRIRLMTAHRSKGQEFERVYLTSAYSGHWGSRRGSRRFNLPLESLDNVASEIKNNDDERRLFYVALTRAKKEVNISFAKESAEGKERLVTQFVSEIDSAYLKRVSSEPLEKEFLKNHSFLFAPTKRPTQETKNKEFVRELFLRRGFSVTHLNNYLTCPWRYFYVNLLQIPKVLTKHQMYGIAVHAAIKQFFDELKNKNKVASNLLLTLFKDNLTQQPLKSQDFNESLKKGKKALKGYYTTYYKDWRQNVITEFNIRGVVFSPAVTLTGKLDKVELLDNAARVNVVDYKTGRVRSRNSILGKTKGSTEDYWRQLVFYKLLLERARPQYKMVTGEIDFIEPNPNGKYKKEIFEVSTEDVKELEKVIGKVTNEILNLSFWQTRCQDKKCEFCALRDLMT